MELTLIDVFTKFILPILSIVIMPLVFWIMNGFRSHIKELASEVNEKASAVQIKELRNEMEKRSESGMVDREKIWKALDHRCERIISSMEEESQRVRSLSEQVYTTFATNASLEKMEERLATRMDAVNSSVRELITKLPTN